ncbi:MAG: hypothetical protein GY854_34670 [Deltaproteobacteria bacterium]|nr:hypothetical protein [Deltaproteobacteria bacterium]
MKPCSWTIFFTGAIAALAVLGCYKVDGLSEGEEESDGSAGGDADGDTDSDVDSDIDSDADSDADSDSDSDSDSGADRVCEPGAIQNCLCGGELEGVQSCRDDGSGWRPCECGAGDVDTDVDGDIDTDADGDIDTDVDGDADGDTDLDSNCDPSYRYPATCIDNDCTWGAACCQGATCNYPVIAFGAPAYAQRYGYATGTSYVAHYCYPLQNYDAQPGITPCECGDVPVSFVINDGTPSVWEACLATGSQVTVSNIEAKIMSKEYMDSMGGALGASDITTCNLPTTLDGTEISLTMCFGYEYTLALDDDNLKDDEVIILGGQGQVGMTEVWIWRTIIPKERWQEGTLPEPYRKPLDDKSDINFLTSLIHGTVVGTSVEQIWLEGWATGGVLTIAETGELCNGGFCPKAEFEMDLDLVAIRAELDM